MQNIKILLSILFLAFLSSCISSDIGVADRSVLQNDLNILDGTYENYPLGYNGNESRRIPLRDLVFERFVSPKYNETMRYSGRLRIKTLDKNKLEIDFLQGDSVVEKKVLKGKIKNNHFIMGRKWRLKGLPVILGAYNESRLAIGVSKEGYLRIVYASHNAGGIMPFGADTNYQNQVYYFANVENKESIYQRCKRLSQQLAKEYPNHPVFFKTEQHSLESFLWLHQPDSLLVYQISPHGVEQLLKAKEENITPNDSILQSFPRQIRLDQNTELGYIRYTNGEFKKYLTTVSLPQFMYEPHDPNLLETYIRQDLAIISGRLRHYMTYDPNY